MNTPRSWIQFPLQALRVAAGLFAGYVGMLLLMAVLALPLDPLISRSFHGLAWSEPAPSPYVASTMCLAGLLAAWAYARLTRCGRAAATGFGAGALLVVLCMALLPLWIPMARYTGPEGRAITEYLAGWSVAACVTIIVGLHAAVLLTRANRGPTR